jgi:hypothetical protein
MSDLFIRQELQKRVLLHGHAEKDVVKRDEEEEEEETEEEEEEEEEEEYLDDEQLHYDFGVCRQTRDVTKVFTVRVCAYDLRWHTTDAGESTPFVLHLLQYDGQVFDYPKFSFRCANEDNGEYFKNECLIHLAQVVDGDDAVYRGFERYKDDEIYAFFNVKHGQMIRDATLVRQWATMDEIMNQRHVLGFPVRPFPVFLEKPHCIFVKQRGLRVYVPEVMYLCDDVGGKWTNVFSSDAEALSSDQSEIVGLGLQNGHSPSPPSEIVQFMENRISHPILGDFYIFSKNPLQNGTAASPVKRYVGFCEDAIYLTKPLPSTALQLGSMGNWIPNLVNYFTRTAADPSAVLVDPSSAIVVDPSSAIVVDPSSATVVDPSSAIVVDPSSAIVTSAVAPDVASTNLKDPQQDATELTTFLSMQSASCIYFQEIVNEVRIPFWCIKSEQYYVEI